MSDRAAQCASVCRHANGFTSGTKQAQGTIFRISFSGEFEVLFNFDGTHGATPTAGLIQANDGNFYGVTSFGGPYQGGVVFKMTPAR